MELCSGESITRVQKSTNPPSAPVAKFIIIRQVQYYVVRVVLVAIGVQVTIPEKLRVSDHSHVTYFASSNIPLSEKTT